jgi:gliding motility-associated-like protein
VNSVTTSNAGVYTVTVTDGNGCVDAATVSVTVNSLPVVTATGSTVCLNQTISLSSAPNGAGSYSWAGPNSYSSNQQNPTIPNATVNMSGSYVVTVTDLNGCVNANVAQVTVNQLPVITVTSGTICAGKSTTLTASGATSYAWAPPAGLSSTTGATVSASLNATSVYTVTGTDNNGCQSVSTTTLTVNPVPNVVAGPLNTSGCVPLCVTFTNTGTSAGSCNWSFGDGNISAGNCSPQNCFQKPGTYTIKLTLTDANGCVDSSTASVTAFPIPHADFSASPQPTTILDPEIQFTDLSSNATITGWHWSMGDNSSSILQNPTHLYSDTGTYAVQLVVISDHGCKDSITKTVDIQPSFTFYIPNAFSPNEDGINESFKGTGMGIDNTTYNLWIFDRWGMMIFYSNDLEKSWDGRIQGKGGDVVQEDVYVWKVHFHDLNGKIHEYKGTVSVIK